MAFGNVPAFAVPSYELVSPVGLFFHTLLGLLAAVGAIVRELRAPEPPARNG